MARLSSPESGRPSAAVACAYGRQPQHPPPWPTQLREPGNAFHTQWRAESSAETWVAQNADYERSISAAGRCGARVQMFPFGAAFDRPGPLRPRRRLFQQPPGLDRRGPCPHLASIASSALTATAAREALYGSTPTPPLRSGCRCRARQAQASHTNEVHDRSWSGAQADGGGHSLRRKVPKPAPDAGRLGARR
jgi:hypothetical protein